MKLAVFAEIPVPKPWTPGKEQRAFQDTIEQAVFAEKMGFHSFWSVEHHFLTEMSHSSNPEIVYGAIAARTSKLRLGYGVRLMPKPYNHPVRTAESVATLDVVSGGRVEMGAGRSATRVELEGFGINPHETRQMQEEAMRAIVGCWTKEEFEFEGKYWSLPRRTVVPRPVQTPHPPVWCASSSLDGHFEIGKMGVGLLSFAVAVPPESMRDKIDAYRSGLQSCTAPVGLTIHERVGAMSLTHCAESDERAKREAGDSILAYLKHSFPLYAEMPSYARRFQQDLGTFSYTSEIKKQVDAGGGSPNFDFQQIWSIGGALVGSPERCIELALRYEEVGVDLLFCLLNTWSIPHEQVMRSIELLGTHVVPVLEERERRRSPQSTGRARPSEIRAGAALSTAK
jgi:alkanesulfonate monooxygenase SsuD/methylene tetrahydromethanopterin reductase-like flavin-dependent oxidoreductase (luciferase family)